MEVLLLVGAIVILGIWVGWQEYRITKIREDVDNNIERLGKHARAIYGDLGPFPFCGRDGKDGIFYRLGAIERKLRAAEDQERVERRKAEMKEYIFNDGKIAEVDGLIDKLYDMAHGVSIDEEEEHKNEK